MARRRQELQWRHRFPDGNVVLSDRRRLDFWYNRHRDKVLQRQPLISWRWEKQLSTGTEHDTAVEKAEAALRRYLTPQQWREFCATSSFTAVGQNTHTPYRVQIGRVIQPGTHYCIWARYYDDSPTADVLLSLALMIQLDESRFLRTAIPSHYTGITF